MTMIILIAQWSSKKYIQYMTLLVHKHTEKLFQLLATCVRDLFTVLLVVI